MPKTLKEEDWSTLLGRIAKGRCTPLIGAGACVGAIPLGSEIANQWAREYDYPLEDSTDLVRVAQFLVVKNQDWMLPKEKILELIENAESPDFTEPDEPHGVLASLPLPVYMTTNYDDFMVRALKARHKEPKQELCRWNKLIKDRPSVFDAAFEPTPANPVVYHLHGHGPVENSNSLVLTEDDYLDFLVSISTDRGLLPPRIQEALAGASLLFVGYSLTDWDFRVLFRGLVTSKERSLRRISVTVQLQPGQEGLQDYLDQYFWVEGMRVYWGTAREFSSELRDRCEDRGILQ